jgi:signal transduction histidine kinase
VPPPGSTLVTAGAERWLPMAAAAVVGLVVTLVVLPAQLLPAAFHAPELHVAVETANVLVGLLVALLVHGRYRTDRRLHQLLLVDALVILAIANVALAVSAGLDESPTVDALRWVSVAGRLLGSGLLCASSLLGAGIVIHRSRARWLQSGLTTVVLLGAGALALGSLPPPVRDAAGGLDTATPALETHPAVVVAQAAGVAFLVVAAVAFTRRALAAGDPLTRWLAAGTVLASFARVHYLLYPSLLSDVVYTGDALRAGFYGCLLIGALQEIEGYWRLRARTAVLDERRRIARDLHDGMTQELTYILAQSRTLASGTGDPTVPRRIEDASSRALDEARRAVHALDREGSRSFVDELRGLADDLAGRHDVDVSVDVDDADGPEPTPEVTEHVLRIVGEAVRNAVRHGDAHDIRISVQSSGMMEPMAHQLTVTDDGAGFDPDATPARHGSGYGLTSMRDRAGALGGTLAIRSAPGWGTTVTLSW